MVLGSVSRGQSPEMGRLGFKQFNGVLAMKMSSNPSRIAVVAASVVATGAAFSAVTFDLTSTTVVPDTLIYASELKVASTEASMSVGELKVPLGGGAASGDKLYLRVELSNGKFASSAASGPTTTGTVEAGFSSTNAFAGVAALSGGGISDNFVVYTLTAGASGQRAVDPVTVWIPPVYTSDMVNPIVVTTKLYSSGEAAGLGTSAPLKSYSGTWVKFSTGLAVKATAMAAASATATVVSSYKKWSSGVSYGGISALQIYPVDKVKGPTGAQVALSDLLGTSSSAMGAAKLQVTGNFAAVASSGLFLADNSACAVGSGKAVAAFTASSVATGTTAAVEPNTVATITLPVNSASAPYGATSSSSPAYLCYTVTETTAIPKVTAIVGKLTLVSSSKASTTTGWDFTNMGAITRDGTTLQAPIVQLPGGATGGWQNRIVLTNTGTEAATYIGYAKAGTFQTGLAAGTVLTNETISGSIPAGGQAVIESINSQMPTFSSNRGWMYFDIGGVNSVVNGVYQLVSPAGSITNTNMLRPNNQIGKD
jgi:hypothetical protein